MQGVRDLKPLQAGQLNPCQLRQQRERAALQAQLLQGGKATRI
jgi:hypothetical protein